MNTQYTGRPVLLVWTPEETDPGRGGPARRRIEKAQTGKTKQEKEKDL